MKIYKYLKDNENTEKTLTEGTLRFGFPSSFNDPFDCFFELDSFVTNSNQLEIAQEYIKSNNYKSWNDYVFDYVVFDCHPNSRKLSTECQKGLRDLVQLCSFTEAFDNRLMWSHYADNHKGLVIGIETINIDSCDYLPVMNNLPFCKQLDGYSLIKLAKVEYANGPWVIELFNLHKESFNKAFLLKDKCWEYEQEWRAIFPPTDNTIYKIMKNKITGIYFGAKMPYERIKFYSKLLEENKINAIKYGMYTHDYKYELNYEQL